MNTLMNSNTATRDNQSTMQGIDISLYKIDNLNTNILKRIFYSLFTNPRRSSIREKLVK